MTDKLRHFVARSHRRHAVSSSGPGRPVPGRPPETMSTAPAQKSKQEGAAGTAEPRWPALVALAALSGAFTSLPDTMMVGPRWLVVGLVLALITPSMIALRLGRSRINVVLGYAVSTVVTLSLVLLMRSLPAKTEGPQELLRSAGVLWISNVLVFALWYWRLDAGGPHQRDQRGRPAVAPSWSRRWPSRPPPCATATGRRISSTTCSWPSTPAPPFPPPTRRCCRAGPSC